MTTIIALIILSALAGLLWRAAASCPLMRLLSCSFDQWAEVSRSEAPPLS